MINSVDLVDNDTNILTEPDTNYVSYPLQNGDSFESGYENRIRVWLFVGFVLGFSSIIAATWIMIADFTIIDEKASRWPGVALLLQNLFIFFSSLLYKFGRQSGDIPYGF